jgi:hypothetical protein
MMRPTIITLAAAGFVIAAAVALAAISTTPTTMRRDVASYSVHFPRNLTGRPFRDCLDLPVECGLVAW